MTEADAPLAERTADARASAALQALACAQDEIDDLRRQVACAEMRVARALAENRRLAVEAERANRREEIASGRAERLASQWDAMRAQSGATQLPKASGAGLGAWLRGIVQRPQSGEA